VSCCRNGRKVCTHRETAVPIAAGIDGEALLLDVPLEFRIRPKVLRVRVARQHPGASPSAMAPEGVGEAVDDRLRPAPESVEKINTKEVSMDLMEITRRSG
jgi:hypothetical protein